MLKKKLFSFFISFLLFFNAGYISPDTTADTLKNKAVLELINKLQGGTPKKSIKITSGQMLNLENRKDDLLNYSGKIILLNLWASWCGYCRQEMPSMEKLYNEFKGKNFIIIAVNIGESMETVKNFIEENNYSFPFFLDFNDSINSVYNTGSFPATYLIDKDGYLIARFIGARDWYSRESIDLVRELTK